MGGGGGHLVYAGVTQVRVVAFSTRAGTVTPSK